MGEEKKAFLSEVFEKVSPWVVGLPVLLYVTGYLIAYGYFIYLGGLWMIGDVPNSTLLYLTMDMATTVAVTAMVCWYLSNWDWTWKFAGYLIPILTLGFVAIYVCVLSKVFPKSALESLGIINVVIVCWAIIPSVLFLSYAKDNKLNLNRSNLFGAVMVSGFGFLLLPIAHGMARGKHDLTGSYLDKIIWKKSDNSTEEGSILFFRDGTYYVVFKKGLREKISEMKLEQYFHEGTDEEASIRAEELREKGQEPTWVYYHLVKVVKEEDVLALLPVGGERLLTSKAKNFKSRITPDARIDVPTKDDTPSKNR